MSTVADNLAQASRVALAMRVITAQLDRGLAARSVLVDGVGVHVIVGNGFALARWHQAYPHGHVVVGGAQVPIHVALEDGAA